MACFYVQLCMHHIKVHRTKHKVSRSINTAHQDKASIPIHTQNIQRFMVVYNNLQRICTLFIYFNLDLLCISVEKLIFFFFILYSYCAHTRFSNINYFAVCSIINSSCLIYLVKVVCFGWSSVCALENKHIRQLVYGYAYEKIMNIGMFSFYTC